MSDETDTTSELERLAAVMDPEAFEPWEPKSERHLRLRGLQIAGRQAIALRHAKRVIEAGLLREETDSAEPCTSEVWSMDYYRDGQVDPYWIRCNAIGPHVEHEDANTGLTWTTDEPEGVQDAQNGPQDSVEDVPGGDGRSGRADGASVGTLSARLRALIPETYSDDGYFGVTALEIGEFADEAHRLEVHARVVEQSLRTAREDVERVRALAQWFQDQGLDGYARKVQHALEMPCTCKGSYEPTCPAHGDGHTPEPQHEHRWAEVTTYADRGCTVEQCTIPGCGVKRDVDPAGVVLGLPSENPVRMPEDRA